MRLLGLIPARAGSKGVPGKNTRLLGGVPLIAHAIRAAREAGVLDRLVLSTDSPEIAALGRAFGADAPWLRPPELATDKASMPSVVLHALDRLELDGQRYDAVLLLQPTSPFRTARMIRRAVGFFKKSGGDSVLSVTPVRDHPAWAFRLGADAALESVLAQPLPPPPRQALEPVYALDGSINLATTRTLREAGSFYSRRTRGLVVEREEALDIDTPADWEQAERQWSRPRAERARKPARCYVIAEAGVNHNGDLALAKRLVRAARDAGADAVKFQTFKAERLVAASAPLAPYQKKRRGARSQLELIRALELSEAAHRELFKFCHRLGIDFLSTPFDEESADFLDGLGVPAFKLPSGEITNRRLLEHVASKGRPVILSTGMSTLEEAARAASWIRGAAAVPLTVLHCVTEYPAPPEQVNLRAMDTLRDALGVPAGYSDHTLGTEIAVAAAARGAAVIEKHLTLDRTLPGPDHRASLEPEEFSALVRAIRAVESSLGDGVKRMAPCEAKNRLVARRSVVAARDLARGHVLSAEDLLAKRPGTGISPERIDELVGRTLRKPLRRDQLLTWEAL